MSLVVFPFKEETVEVVASNIETAARHERVDEVWAVAAAEGAAMSEVTAAGRAIGDSEGKPVAVFAQDRLGELRSGKGDGMNTAIARAAQRGFARVHFYDADITNFDHGWIDGAEAAADRGFGVVRHKFPRAATDAMITWMVTRPALAKLYPGTLLPRLGQPLGGELLLTGPVVEALAADPFVIARSDWGIDTLITHATAVMGGANYEHNVADGKRHALYGSLTDIEDMILECLDAVASLHGHPGPPAEAVLESDPPAPVPSDLTGTIAYDIKTTRASVAQPPSPAEREILESVGVDPDHLGGIDASKWGAILDDMLLRFDLAEQPWRAAAFRLWVERVITYTLEVVVSGYDHAMAYLEETISQYEEEALGRRSD